LSVCREKRGTVSREGTIDRVGALRQQKLRLVADAGAGTRGTARGRGPFTFVVLPFT
jgi:hypothetical protein